MEFEADLIKFFQTNATGGWVTFFQGVTMLGSYLGFLATFIIIFVKNKKLSFVFALTFAIASGVNFLLKMLIARQRPFDSYDFIKNLGGEDGYSMPSGHSMCSALFATFLIYHLYKIRKDRATKIWGTICLSLFPALIALSRMVLGVHYLTDTIVGIIVGIMFAFLGIWVYNVVEKKKAKEENR